MKHFYPIILKNNRLKPFRISPNIEIRRLSNTERMEFFGLKKIEFSFTGGKPIGYIGLRKFFPSKKHGRLPPEEFRQKCVEWTGECIGNMKKQMKAIGFSPDWRYEYKTMDPDYWRRVQYSILKMYEKGLVYRDEHPVFWCTNCRSAIAKTDTEEKDRNTKLNYLK